VNKEQLPDPENNLQYGPLIDLQSFEQNYNTKTARAQVDSTVFVRTTRNLLAGDFQVLFMLNLFGAKNILNDQMQYAQLMYDKIEEEQIKIEE